MFKKSIATLVALFVFVGTVGCGPDLTFAQESPVAPGPEGTNGTNLFSEPIRQDGSEFGGSQVMPPPPPYPSSPDGDFRQQGEPFQGDMREGGQRFTPPGGSRPQGQPFGGGERPQVKSFDGRGREPQKQQFMKAPQGGNTGEFRGSWSENDAGGDFADKQEDQEKRMEAQEKRMQQEQLKQMKRGMVSGIEQGLKQMTRMVERVSKKGITVPTEVQALLTELSSALEKVKNATELTDDVQDAIETLQEKGQDLRELGQKLGMLEQMSQMTKQVEKELSRIDKEVQKAKKTKIASQFPDVVTKIEGELATLKSKWEGVKGSVLSGATDPDDLRDLMEEMFEQIGEVRQSLGLLKQLSSVSKMITSAGKEIAKFEKEVAKLKKAGMDVNGLSSYLSQAKEALAKITTLSKQAGFDPEDLFDLMQEMEQIRGDALREFDRLTGKEKDEGLGASVIQALWLRRLGL